MSWDKTQIPDQTGKRILITGANSGLGFDTAKVLYGKGADVIIACRTVSKGEEAIREIESSVSSKGSLSLMVLDLASIESIRSFLSAFKEKYDFLDILINNAGIMALPFSRTEDGFESQFGTNHLGHFALTGPLIPLLNKSKDPRVVVLSSLANRLGHIKFNNLNSEKFYYRWIAYCQSKLANILFAQELQRKMSEAKRDIKVVSVHPGFSSTNLQRYMPGHKIINALFSQSSEMGCLPSLFAATSNGIKGGEYIGPANLFEVRGYPEPAYIPKIAKDRDIAKQLWETSVRLTGCRY